MNDIWFIKEGVTAQDEFGHLDLALELKAKIEQLGAPLTLSLEGPHGVGKSYIGSLLKDQMTSDDHEFVRIEAWRHAGDSRRKAFLVDLIDGLCKNRDAKSQSVKDLKVLEDRINQTRAHLSPSVDGAGVRNSIEAVRESWPEILGLIKRFLWSGWGRVITVVGCSCFIALAIWLLSTSKTSPSYAVIALSASFTALVQLVGIGGIFVFILGLSPKILPNWFEASKITVTTAPLNSSEQFENLFRQILNILKKERTGANKPERTLIILVDELDRLPELEIVDSLNVLRAFRDVEPCVIAVALDEAVVKRALCKRKEETAGAIRDDADAEEFLNKFFKLRQHIPPVVKVEMTDFARSLVEKGRITQGVGGLRGTQLESVLECLIHVDVTTPRHVIRLLNAFNSDFHLATRRESAQDEALLHKGTITQHLPLLALLTAIREDFSPFHEALVDNLELLQAMDAGLEHGFDDEWNAGFPGLHVLCEPYFEKVPDTVGLSGKPKSQWRGLILLLRSSRKYHQVEIAPFLFFRQDVAARSLGSEAARALRDELENNFTSNLYERLEKEGAAFAKLLATVALRSLQQARVNRRANVIAAVADLWKLLSQHTEIVKVSELANEVAHLMHEQQAELLPLLHEVAPAHLLNLLAFDTDGFHQRLCVPAQIARLDDVIRSADLESVEEAEPRQNGEAIVKALLEHPELVKNQQDRQKVANFTTWLAAQLTIEEVLPWLNDARAGVNSPDIVPGFFDEHFVDEIFNTMEQVDTKSMTSAIANSFRDFLQDFEPIASSSWHTKWFDNLLELRNAENWPMRDLSLDFLTHQSDRWSDLDAAKAMERVILSSAAETREKKEWDTLANFICSLNTKHKAEVWSDGAIEALDITSAKMVALDNGELRTGAYDLLKEIGGNVQECGPVSKTFNALATYITDKSPDATVIRALETAILLSDSAPAGEWNTLFEIISAPLETPDASEKDAMTWSADALLIALRPDTPAVVQEGAWARYPTLLKTFASASYTNDELMPLVPLWDRSTAVWKSNPSLLAAYLNSINTRLTASITEGELVFLSNRLEVLAENVTIPESYKATLATSLVAKWTNLKNKNARATFENLLLQWWDALTDASVEVFVGQQIVLLQEDPDSAWTAISHFWVGLSTDTRAKALNVVWPSVGEPETLSEPERKALQVKVLQTLADKNQALPAEEISELMVEIERQFPLSLLKPIVQSLRAPQDAGWAQKIAQALLAHYQAQVAPAEFVDLLGLVFLFQSEPLAGTWESMKGLLDSSEKEQQAAHGMMDSFVKANSLSEDQKQYLAVKMASLVSKAKSASLRKWVQNFKEWDVLRFNEVRVALTENFSSRGKSRTSEDREDREDRKFINEILKSFKENSNRRPR